MPRKGYCSSKTTRYRVHSCQFAMNRANQRVGPEKRNGKWKRGNEEMTRFWRLERHTRTRTAHVDQREIARLYRQGRAEAADQIIPSPCPSPTLSLCPACCRVLMQYITNPRNEPQLPSQRQLPAAGNSAHAQHPGLATPLHL